MATDPDKYRLISTGLVNATTFGCDWERVGLGLPPKISTVGMARCPDGSNVPGQGCGIPPKDDQGAPGCKGIGNPIHMVTGAKYESVTDFAIGGDQGSAFGLVRHYNSFARDLSRLGPAWRTVFDRNLIASAQGRNVRLVLGDGREAVFARSSTSNPWSPAYFDSANKTYKFPRADVTWSMTQAADGTWRFTDQDGTVESYSADGQVQSVVRPGGRTWTYAYDAQGFNTLVSDNLGRQITFGYTASGLLKSVTAPDGSVYRYRYTYRGVAVPNTSNPEDLVSTMNVLTSVVYPDRSPGSDADNPVVTYVYEDARRLSALTGIIDERGVRFASWSYNADGRAASSEHANGAERTTIEYDDTANTRTVTNALGKRSVYRLAPFQGKLMLSRLEGQSSLNCVGSDSQFAYDNKGFLSTRTDAEGRVTTFVNDARGLPLSRTDGSGSPAARTTTTTWHPTYRLPTQVTQVGLTTNFTYDAAGRLTEKRLTDTSTQTVPYSTNGQVRAWTYAYTPEGLLDTVDGPLPGSADTTDYVYGPQGHLAKITNALGQVTTVTAVNGLGQPLSWTDANGVLTQLAYDARGRLTAVTVNPGADQSVTAYGYDLAGNLLDVFRPDGSGLHYEYDGARRLVAIRNDDQERITYSRDLLGGITEVKVKSSTGAITSTATKTFDELGRLLSTIGAGGQTTRYSYDRTDNAVESVDPLGSTFFHAFDALNRLSAESGPLQHAITYSYDQRDNLTGVSDPRGLVTSFVYNGFGEVIRRNSPDTGITDYSYDAAGNQISQMDARGITRNVTYDLLNRRTRVEYPADPTQTLTYVYDGANFSPARPYSQGRLTQTIKAGETTELSYDARGNLIQSDSTAFGQTLTTGYQYDAANQLTKLTYPSGRAVTYTRDAQGRIDAVSLVQGGITTPLATQLYYAPFGPLTAYDLPNGAHFRATLDSDYRQTRLRYLGILDRGYTYDSRNNITTIADALDASRSQTFGVDARSRLTSATGPYGNYAYTYDATSNRTSETRNGLTDTYVYSPTSNRLTSISGTRSASFSYNPMGNLASDGTRTYTTDVAGRLASVSQGASNLSAAQRYSPTGQRITKSVGPDVRRTLYDAAGHLLVDMKSTGLVDAEYLWLGDRPLAVIAARSGSTTKEVFYIHADHLGTPLKLTDSTGSVVWDATYEPFGKASLAVNLLNQPLRFPGQVLDQETGLHQNWNRDYDPRLGRYIESDPIGLAGGPNTYAYVGGNPVSNIDPTGLDTIYINYDYYPISTPVGRLPLGHGAVVAVDPVTGTTNYYEFGRYGDVRGVVRGFPDIKIPNVTIGPDGVATPDSLRRLYDFLSKTFGQGVNVSPSYYPDSDYQGTIRFAERFRKKHPDYDLLSNNCKTFGRAAAVACEEGAQCR